MNKNELQTNLKKLWINSDCNFRNDLLKLIEKIGNDKKDFNCNLCKK